MEPTKEPTTTSQTGTQTIDDATRQAQAAGYRQPPQVIIANPQVQYVTAQPINNGYAIQGITVPYDSRQVMFNDDVLVDIIPAQKTKVIIANQPQINTVCTSGVPQLFYCTTDKKTLVSQVRYKSDAGMLCCWICLFILLFPFSLFFICCWPLGYREAIHTCPECHKEVGRVPTLF